MRDSKHRYLVTSLGNSVTMPALHRYSVAHAAAASAAKSQYALAWRGCGGGARA